jgi:hypothetical protein
MGAYLLGIGLVIAGILTEVLTDLRYADALIGSGVCAFGFAILRTIWRFFNASTVARKAGEIAAKGANHVDTFKEAFKDARNK